jgi:hypothetical protein
MSNDPDVVDESGNVIVGKSCHPLNVEACERTAEVFAFPQDREPTQTRLKALEADFFEQSRVVVHRASPFTIVVFDIQRIVTAPPTAQSTVAVGS